MTETHLGLHDLDQFVGEGGGIGTVKEIHACGRARESRPGDRERQEAQTEIIMADKKRGRLEPGDGGGKDHDEGREERFA